MTTTAKTEAGAGSAVLGAFKGEIAAVSTPLVYRLALLFVALAMILLPLVYLGLIGLSAYVVYYHATANTDLMEAGKAGLLAYVAPLVVGAILVLFMTKPLFVPRTAEQRGRRVSEEDEPLLFAFVGRLCQLVGAPRPREIRVDNEVNASASLRRGLLSMFGSDLVLTIGLPLVAGLSLRQLAGVLAHEFGHFAQAAGMRLTYIIRAVSMWFGRVVYERDAWDERLVAWSEGIDIRIGIIFYLARFFVWVTRKILWLLMMLGHLLSCFLLRQMEYDADRYEARLCGSATFERTARRLPVLAIASERAKGDLEEFWSEARLPDDLPALMLANVDQLEGDIDQIQQMVDERKTGIFDTHPADSDRIASARREASEGSFDFDGPATVLFSDFAALSREVSFDLYRGVLGDQVGRHHLHPVSELLERQRARIGELKTQWRFFQGMISPLRPLELPPDRLASTTDDLQEATETLQEMREGLLANRERYDAAYQRFDAVDSRFLLAAQAEALLAANIRFAPAVFQLPAAEWAGVDQARRQGNEEVGQLSADLEPTERLATWRLLTALGLLRRPEIIEQLEDGATLPGRVDALLATLRRVSPLLDDATSLRNVTNGLVTLLQQVEGNEHHEQLHGAIVEQIGQVEKKLRALLEPLGAALYPFEHGAGEETTIADYLAPRRPDGEDIGVLLEAASGAVDRIYRLYLQVIGALASTAERIEQVLGLPPLPEPPEDGGGEQREDEDPAGAHRVTPQPDPA